MHRQSRVSSLGAAVAALCAIAIPVAAQAPAPKSSGAPAAGQWNSTVAPAQGTAAVTLDEKQVATLKRVSTFFNELKQIKGNFVQTNPDGKRLRGKFVMKQPGKFRFDYGGGTKMVIISDGTYLAVEDHDLNNENTVELDKTPFRVLLRKDVDLIRDANVTEVQEVDDLIIIALQDKSPDAPGKIRLFLTKKPALEIKEWVTTDPQGTDTRVEVSDLNRAEDVDDGLFKRGNLTTKKTQ
jgi:outer membrane lipoprotein-sorting protein